MKGLGAEVRLIGWWELKVFLTPPHFIGEGDSEVGLFTRSVLYLVMFGMTRLGAEVYGFHQWRFGIGCNVRGGWG